MLTRFFIQRLGSHVDPIRPDDCRRFRVDPDLSKVGQVTERFKDSRPFLGREVDVTYRAIVEEQPETVVADNGDADNSG